MMISINKCYYRTKYSGYQFSRNKNYIQILKQDIPEELLNLYEESAIYGCDNLYFKPQLYGKKSYSLCLISENIKWNFEFGEYEKCEENADWDRTKYPEDMIDEPYKAEMVIVNIGRNINFYVQMSKIDELQKVS